MPPPPTGLSRLILFPQNFTVVESPDASTSTYQEVAAFTYFPQSLNIPATAVTSAWQTQLRLAVPGSNTNVTLVSENPQLLFGVTVDPQGYSITDFMLRYASQFMVDPMSVHVKEYSNGTVFQLAVSVDLAADNSTSADAFSTCQHLEFGQSTDVFYLGCSLGEEYHLTASASTQANASALGASGYDSLTVQQAVAANLAAQNIAWGGLRSLYSKTSNSVNPVTGRNAGRVVLSPPAIAGIATGGGVVIVGVIIAIVLVVVCCCGAGGFLAFGKRKYVHKHKPKRILKLRDGEIRL
jgi:hypothetical protein